ncbi:MAG: T9SS type A sorting domain-containing protein, partial [Flavobacteriales bacterium]|nr:T9SS type A sorting domain-containing protein [Flavobacteriales bacterium]
GNIIVSTFSKLFVVRPSDAIIDMSISETTAKTSFSVYPNPTTNELTIQLENFNSSAQDVISIIDIEGRVVKEINTSALPFGTITLDVSYLSEGMYLVRFNESGLTQRFIKG